MRAVDTNVLVRLVARDDARQAASAEAFVATGAWVSHLVLVEAVWVWTSVYKLGPREIVLALEMLLNHQHLTIQDPSTIAAALETYRRRAALGFSDCLVLEVARRAGHLPLGTIDHALGQLDDVQEL